MMKTSTARRLLLLNRTFYNRFAREFSESRRVLQPGILRALRDLGQYESLLDLGCGDGRLLTETRDPFACKSYLGVDDSSELLSLATATATALPRTTFVHSDLSSAGWSHGLERSFDVGTCFSVLHHIPGPRRRLRVLSEMCSLLRPGARCAVSVWQFRHVPRLQEKIVAWEEIGLDADEVDRGDHLLDWKRGGRGLRYVHQFDEMELVNLCQRAGFVVDKTYRSDGETGDMGLYTICHTYR